MTLSKINFKFTTQLVLSFLICFFLTSSFMNACTIASGIASNGHVWTANNEDGPFGVANFINVFPRSGTDRYGYYTLSYISPLYGQNGAMQGGMNQVGLSFDFNAIPFVENFNSDIKKPFPDGNDAILTHILGNMRSVQEVIAFFETYWFENGFRDAQMHVSDANGRFAIISASGMELVKAGDFLVSTNFDMCSKKDASSCWRYPTAVDKLAADGASFDTMEFICRETAQKNGATMYSNIQNLTTREIWFFSKHDMGTIVHTNLEEMLSKGQKSYSFSDLKSLKKLRPERNWKAPTQSNISPELLTKFSGVYEHPFIGTVNVTAVDNALEISFPDGNKEVFYLSRENVFSLPDYDLFVSFEQNPETDRPQISLYENGLWSFSAEKSGKIEANTNSKK